MSAINWLTVGDVASTIRPRRAGDSAADNATSRPQLVRDESVGRRHDNERQYQQRDVQTRGVHRLQQVAVPTLRSSRIYGTYTVRQKKNREDFFTTSDITSE